MIDRALQERLTLWHTHLEKLAKVEEIFFNLEASEKSLYSQLFLDAKGKNVAEREAEAYTSAEWRNFRKGLAVAKSAYNHERRMLDLLMKAYESTYLTMKLEAEAVKRHP